MNIQVDSHSLAESSLERKIKSTKIPQTLQSLMLSPAPQLQKPLRAIRTMRSKPPDKRLERKAAEMLKTVN